MRNKLFFLILTFVLILVSTEAKVGHIHPTLEKKLQKLPRGEKLAVIVELVEQASLQEVIARIPGAGRRERAWAVVNALRNVAAEHQGPIKTYLKQKQVSKAAERVIPFWIFNGIAVTADEPLIRDLAARPEVREVRLDAQIPVPSLTPAEAGGSFFISEWNIGVVRAPEVWALNPAYNGAGAVVGSFDTGVDLTHPDLYSRYRGTHQISWFDPYGEHSIPYDFYGHGTHTTGIAVGGDAAGSYIGVAPGAAWIAAKGWDDDGIGLVSAFHNIFEWFLAPGGYPDYAPDVVNCSWSFEESGCEIEFLPDIQAWRAAGIFPAFAAGNDGPYSGSVRSPAAYPISFAVGSTGYMDEVSSFSARGPSPCDDSIKPDICAPGDGIFSAVPWGYEILSGTSMAAPHVAGAVALLRSINPALTVDQLESTLFSGANDLEEPGLDNDSGAGRLDLFVSAQAALYGPDAPVVKIMATDDEATEAGPTSGTFTVSRSGATDEDLEVRYAVSGTATAGSDYESIAESVAIPEGSTEATILITPIDDLLAEENETVTLALVSDPAYIISATDTATVTIISDELLSDLRILSLTAPATAGAGESFTVTDTTKNQGGGAADPSTTQFYLSMDNLFDASDTLIGSRSVPVLGGRAIPNPKTSRSLRRRPPERGTSSPRPTAKRSSPRLPRPTIPTPGRSGSART